MCDAGYYCTASSTIPNPLSTDAVVVGGMCEKGFYCPKGSGAPT